MVTVVVFEFCVMRCQPLRRALGVSKLREHNMDVIIPSVSNKHGAQVEDILLEQILLCKANISTIERVAVFRKDREINNEINRRIRECNIFLATQGDRKGGCLYREVGIDAGNQVCEHAIPVSELVNLYKMGRPIEDLIFYPVARISKESDKKLRSLGLAKKGHDLKFVLSRYFRAEIAIETFEGKRVDCEKWTMEDHWFLVESSKKVSSIRNSLKVKLSEHT
ncbi:TPA: hypothetical protein ACVU01_003509 [Vibrio cholerae]